MFYKEYNNFIITCIMLFYKLFEPRTWFPKKEPATKTTCTPVPKDFNKSIFCEDKLINKFLNEYTLYLDNVKWIHNAEYVGASGESISFLYDNYRILWNHDRPGYLFLIPK